MNSIFKTMREQAGKLCAIGKVKPVSVVLAFDGLDAVTRVVTRPGLSKARWCEPSVWYIVLEVMQQWLHIASLFHCELRAVPRHKWFG